jgi:hypothetical protein
MKLATALSQRADLQKRTAELNTRLRNNAKVQDGEQPAEKPAELLKELDAVLLQLEELVARINLTNSSTVFEGKTVTELIARRDMLSKKLGILRGFLDEASSKIDRYSRAEIKIVSTVDVAKLQKQVDALSKELRETDEKLQEINWTTELK